MCLDETHINLMLRGEMGEIEIYAVLLTNLMLFRQEHEIYCT